MPWPPASRTRAGRGGAASARVLVGPRDPVEHPAQQEQEPEHDRGDDRVGDPGEVAGTPDFSSRWRICVSLTNGRSKLGGAVTAGAGIAESSGR